MSATAVQRIFVWPLAIPMRRTVAHAASERSVADPVVVQVELGSGVTGYGETLPRPYVTGETVPSVQSALRGVLMQHVLSLHPASFTEALEGADSLPFADERDRPICAARAAMELALLDAYAQAFDRPLSSVAGWMGLGGFGTPGSLGPVRASGVLANRTTAGVMKTLRLLWWYGLRQFKLKVGDGGDAQRVERVYAYLRSAIDQGKASLRLDANGAWSKDEAIDKLADWRDLALAGVEQPLARGREDDLPLLKHVIQLPLIHDESLVTLGDARRLHEAGVADAFNIRISKCGGLLPALRLAAFARRHGVRIQLGCMVGETSILCAAGLRFVEVTPGVTFLEGCFGSFLLRRDVVRRPLRFGYGGRLPRLGPVGLGARVDPDRLRALCPDGPETIPL